MQKFTTITSQIISLPYKDIDTDMIIPAEYLKTTTKTGLGKYAFINMKKAYSDFPDFSGKQIIVAGKNFGCGSSREHAPWALLDAGIRVVIASEFADIFRLNSEKNGLLLVQLKEEEVQEILSDVGCECIRTLQVDLEKQTVGVNLCVRPEEDSGQTHRSAPTEKTYHFEINNSTKQKLLEGLDDLDYILKFRKEIEEFNK